MKIQIAALIAAVVFGSHAYAEQPGPSVEKLKYRKWDAGGSLGIAGASRRDLGGNNTGDCTCGDSLAWIGNIDVGRYLSPHLKVEAGLMRSSQRRFYSTNYSYPLTFPYSSTTRTVNPTSASGAVTYQFLENSFAHPYVSAGIRMTSLSEETRTVTYNPNFSAPPSISSGSRKFAEARPFVAAGYKSYFNERAFMRSDVLMALDKKGPSHATVRLGFGIDF